MMKRPTPFQFHDSKDPNAPSSVTLSTSTEKFTPVTDADLIDYHHLVKKWREEQGTLAKKIITENHSSDKHVRKELPGLDLYARVRPVLPNVFNESAESPCWETLTCITPFLFEHTAELRFGLPTGRLLSTPQRFTQTFPPDCQESDVYNNAVRPLIDAALDGNEQVLVLAFGQTGSGKTHTMSSCMRSALAQLYAKEASTKVQYFEISGKVLDLLSERKECVLRTDSRGDVHVVGLKSITCETLEEMENELSKGVLLRATASTQSNSQSSRSHAVLVIELSGGGRIRMVDLAGSEKSKDATTHTSKLITELQQINWSLGTLKACIRSMYLKEVHGKSGEHVNYRNSKLTLLLRDMFENQDQPVVEEIQNDETKTEGTKTEGTKKRPRPRTVFIACFAPLDKHKLHSVATAKYCRQLRAVGSVRDGKRAATTDELCEALVLYYLDVCPERAKVEAVRKTLSSFVGREKKLHGGLKKKYGRAPDVLLRAPRPEGSSKSPLEWTRKEIKTWLTKTIKNEMNEHTVPEDLTILPSKLNVTGNQMYSLSVHDIVRRCGGGTSCAAFNSEDHTLFDPDSGAIASKIDGATHVDNDKVERQRMEKCGRFIFEAFRTLVKEDKKKH